MKGFKTVTLRENTNSKLHLPGENVSPVTCKIREEDGIVTSRPVSKSFQNNTKWPIVCEITRGKEEVKSLPSTFNAIEEIQPKDELFALVFTQILFGDLAGELEWCKVLPTSRSNCSVKIERYPCWSFCKVGEQRCNKGQPKHRGFVLSLFVWKPFNPSLTRLVHPFTYLDIARACFQ